MNSFFSSALSVSHLRRSLGHGVSLAFCGMTPSFFWLAKICSRSAFQPLSNYAVEFLDPLRRRVVRRVGAARHVVAEERLVGGDLVELLIQSMASSAIAVVRFQPGWPTYG